MKDYNQIYGEYTSGTGAWLDDKLFSLGINDPYSEIIIDSYITQVSIDLNRLCPLISVKGKKFMDVGTGRQALALNKMGAKSVDHFDISKGNINKFKRFLDTSNLKIKSKYADISSIEFATDEKFKRYDCIYLQGIIQHVKDPLQTLKNLSFVCNDNGVIWLYYYQSGSPTHLYWDAIRKILGSSLNNLSFIHSYLRMIKFSDKFINMIMDNIGCSYRHLLDSSFYIEVMKQNGFELIMNKDIFDNKNGLNLRITTPACIAGFKKTTEQKISKIRPHKTEYTDHFNYKNFRNEDQDLVKKISAIFIEIKTLLNDSTFKKSQLDLLNTSLPLLNEVLNYKISSPFLIVEENLIDSFTKSLNILKGLKKN